MSDCLISKILRQSNTRDNFFSCDCNCCNRVSDKQKCLKMSKSVPNRWWWRSRRARCLWNSRAWSNTRKKGESDSWNCWSLIFFHHETSLLMDLPKGSIFLLLSLSRSRARSKTYALQLVLPILRESRRSIVKTKLAILLACFSRDRAFCVRARFPRDRILPI